jgi:amino-acid N-acetyltransferase
MQQSDAGYLEAHLMNLPDSPGTSRTKAPRREWTLRPASPHELPEAARVLHESDLPLDELEEQFGEAYVLAWSGDRVVGVAGLETYGSHGFLRSVAVLPEERGSGLGRALVRDRLDRARALNLDDVHLLTMNAADYFQRLGFVTVPRSEAPGEIRESCQFTTTCPDSAALMRFSSQSYCGA